MTLLDVRRLRKHFGALAVTDDSLPKTPSGKLQRVALRELAESGDGRL